MPQARPIQTNFTSGELSERMRGRVDLEQYNNGAAELFNFRVLPQGGAARRDGSYYVAAQKDMTKRVVMRSFRVSPAVAYVIEFGEGYARFFRNRAPLLDGTGAPIEVVTPYTEAELRELRFVQSVDVLYVAHANHQPRKITRATVTA
jgi:hypothetical protein